MKEVIDKPRFLNNQDYRGGVLDGLAHAVNTDAEVERERTLRRIESRDRMLRKRMHGWESPEWCCYFWFVGWDCISLGLHVCLGGPNLEIHIPFGFIRIGRHTDVQARRDIDAMMPSERTDA